MRSFARLILILVVFFAAAALLYQRSSLLLNCTLWFFLPLALWLAGVRARKMLVPAFLVAGLALGLALGFLALRELYFPRYEHRELVKLVAAGGQMDMAVRELYRGMKNCGPARWGQLCRDERGQRIFPQPSASRKKGLLFLGCSFTDAQNLPDEQAFPFVTAKALRRPLFSLAESGGGMNTMLFRIERLDRFVPADLSFSAAIYTFIPQHFARAAGLGNMRYARNLPHYELESGALALKGTHFDFFGGDFWMRKLGPEMFFFFVGLIPAHSSFLTAPALPDGTIELAAAEVNRMAELFKARHGGRFVLNIWPGSRFPDREAFLKRLAPGVEVWESAVEGRMDRDNHPDTAFHREMGSFLATKLREPK